MFHETPKKNREKTDKDIHDRLYDMIKEIEERVLDAKEGSSTETYQESLAKFQSV
jgi:hypothetical protein